MRLYVKHAASGDYVYFMESYRDPITRKPRSRIVKSFGRLDELLAADPEVLSKLRDEAMRLNALDDEATAVESSFSFSYRDNGFEGMPLLNYGIFLYRALWDELKLDDVFRSPSALSFSAARFRRSVFLLSALRNIEPLSKIATFRRKEGYLFDFADVREHDMYRSLGVLAESKEKVERHLFMKLRDRPPMDASYDDGSARGADVSVAFYDVTTYYFESVSQDALKAFGFSKDNRVNEVQVVMGLLIDGGGMPLGYELYPGNTSEILTLLPVLKKLKRLYGIKKVIVVADRGLNSKSNLAAIKQLGFEYVFAFKLKGAASDVLNDVLDEKGYVYLSGEGEGFCLKYKSFPHSTVFSSDGEKVLLEDRLIVSYSEKRASKDRKERERLVAKAKKLVEKPSLFVAELKRGGKSFVIADFDGRSLKLDEDRIRRQSIFDGYYGIICSDTSMTDEEATAIHHRLWKIEESFRVLKSCLKARPCYVWTQGSIRGHFLICYLALVMQRLLEKKLKEAGIKATTKEILSAISSAEVMAVKGKVQTIYIKREVEPLYEQMAKLLGMEPLRSRNTHKDIQNALHRRIPLT